MSSAFLGALVIDQGMEAIWVFSKVCFFFKSRPFYKTAAIQQFLM